MGGSFLALYQIIFNLSSSVCRPLGWNVDSKFRPDRVLIEIFLWVAALKCNAMILVKLSIHTNGLNYSFPLVWPSATDALHGRCLAPYGSLRQGCEGLVPPKVG